jgi:hypothetical protein
MISPNTPPGAELVCIDVDDGAGGLPRLVIGQIYILDHIEDGCVPVSDDPTEFAVAIAGVDHDTPRRSRAWRIWESKRLWFYSRACFRLLDKAADPSFYTAHIPVNLETIS